MLLLHSICCFAHQVFGSIFFFLRTKAFIETKYLSVYCMLHLVAQNLQSCSTSPSSTSTQSPTSTEGVPGQEETLTHYGATTQQVAARFKHRLQLLTDGCKHHKDSQLFRRLKREHCGWPILASHEHHSLFLWHRENSVLNMENAAQKTQRRHVLQRN